MSAKKNFVSKLRSSLSFRQITNYCKMHRCKNVQFYRICRCVNVFSFYCLVTFGTQREYKFDIKIGTVKIINVDHCMYLACVYHKCMLPQIFFDYFHDNYTIYSRDSRQKTNLHMYSVTQLLAKDPLNFKVLHCGMSFLSLSQI